MTLAILWGSSPFVFIARDRRLSWPEPGPDGWFAARGEAEHPMVRVHPERAVIWAGAGIGTIKTDQREAVDDVIARTISSVHGSLSQNLVPALGNALDTLATDEINEVERLHLDGLLGKPALIVLLGMHERGAAGGVLLQFTKDGPYVTNTMGHVSLSPHSKPFFDSLTPRELWPHADCDPLDGARHLHRISTRAIGAAERLAGWPADIGGLVDVAMVGPRGAEVLPPEVFMSPTSGLPNPNRSRLN